LRRGIARRVVDGAKFGIDVRLGPDSSAAVLPEVAALRPRLVALFVGPRHGPKMPNLFPRVGVERHDARRQAPVASGRRKDLPLEIRRRLADALGVHLERRLVAEELMIPDLLAGLLAQCPDDAVAKTDEDFAVAERDPVRVRPAGSRGLLGQSLD